MAAGITGLGLATVSLLACGLRDGVVACYIIRQRQRSLPGLVGDLQLDLTVERGSYLVNRHTSMECSQGWSAAVARELYLQTTPGDVRTLLYREFYSIHPVSQ